MTTQRASGSETAPDRAPARPRGVRGVLFDMDGVLLDSARAWYEVIRQGRRRYGEPDDVSFETFAATFGQGPEADQRQFFPRVASVEEVSALYAELFPQQLDRLRLMDGAPQVLGALAARGIGRAVVTNTPTQLAHQILERLELMPLLDATATAGEAAEKPSPELIHLALARLSLAPSEVIYVGDSASDRAAASAAGVHMLGLNAPGDVTITTLLAVLDLLE